METEEKLLTVSEVASFLRLTGQTVRKLNIPRLKIGKIIRYKKTDVESWLKENKK